jgi:hypothetical protein
MNLDTTRRRFMQLAAAVVSGAASEVHSATRTIGHVEITIDPAATQTKAESVKWSVDLLRSSLEGKGVTTNGSSKAAARILVSPLNSSLVKGFSLPQSWSSEMVVLLPGRGIVRSFLLVAWTRAELRMVC